MKKIETTKTNEALEFKYIFDNQEWKKILKKEENKLLKDVKIDGFRPGSQAAKDQAKKMINEKNLLNDGATAAIKFGIHDLVLSKDFLELEDKIANMPPEVNILKISNEELEVTYKFKRNPIVTVGDWKTIKLSSKLLKPTSEEIQTKIDGLLKEHSRLEPKVKGKIELNNTVTFDFKGYLDNTPFENGEAKNYDLEIGSNQFIPGFEDQMIGLEIGDEKSINVTFPENYHEKKLAGKPVKFDVKIHDIKMKTIPELNDDFIKDLKIENVFNLKDLKNHFKNELEIVNENNYNRDVENELVQALIDMTKLSYEDDNLFEGEKNQIIDRNKKQFSQYGISFEDFLKMSNMTEEKFNEQAKGEAKKLYLYKQAMDEIVKRDKDFLTDSEFKEEIEKISKDSQKTFDEVIKLIGNNEKLIKKDLLRLKKVRSIIKELTKTK